ncbi:MULTISPECIES: hypothetical protein [Aeromonas]|nr:MULTISPECIES: hypothetical protein [Aeromonas]MDX7730396.1 hypothetical protein [Aeromonas caviae]
MNQMKKYFIEVIWPVMKKHIISFASALLGAILKDAFSSKPSTSTS